MGERLAVAPPDVVKAIELRNEPDMNVCVFARACAKGHRTATSHACGRVAWTTFLVSRRKGSEGKAALLASSG